MLIEDERDLRELIARIDHAPVAFDVEGDGLFRYRPRLCTIQLASRDEIAIVDTLRISLAPMRGMLGRDGPRKIVHDAAFDARLLAEHGIALGCVFDTSVAARFLGETATGLSSLVHKYLGVTLAKEKQQADWGKRPLDPHDVAYLEGDVKHLHELADALLARVCEKGIELEVAEECDYVVERAATSEPDPVPPWTRIKGALELPPDIRVALRELALERELVAEDLDVPPFKVATNEVLLAIAHARPRRRNELASIPGASRGRAGRCASRWLDAIDRSRDMIDVPDEERAPKRVPPREERERQKVRHKALSAWRKRVAAERDVDPQVVLPGHCLNDLVRRGARNPQELAAIAGLGWFRIERDGSALIAVCA